jgi:hexulose-6-phosphate isomerase
MTQAAALNVNRIVVPFVDASSIRSAADFDGVVHGIGAMQDLIDRTKVELHLETSLSPSEFASLLAQLPHRGVKVNYDSGNSASLGFRPADEFAAYGARVGSVHLKDRRHGGSTVPLGEGDTDFAALFECLRAVSYSGDFILQVARGTEGDELEWTRRNVRTASEWMRSLKSA